MQFQQTEPIPQQDIFVFEVHEQAEKYTPAANTLTVPFNHKITDDEVKGKVIAKPGTPAFPTGTIFEVVSKPETNTTGTDKKAVVKNHISR